MTENTNDFWELEEQNIAHLSDTEMDRLEKLELASQGKIPPGDAPELIPVPEMGDLPTEEWFQVGDVVFRNRDQAEVFLTLNPHTREGDYRLSWRNDTKKPKEIDSKISTCHLLPEDRFTEILDLMVERDTAADANTTRKDEWEKAKKAATDILSKMRKERFRCQDLLTSAHLVEDTLQEYIELTGGDRLTAMRFLKKAFTTDQITRSIEWISRPTGEKEDLATLLDEIMGEIAVAEESEPTDD